MRPPCGVAGCEGMHVANGWCAFHYRRVARYGTPDKPASPDIRERLLTHIEVTDTGYATPCWLSTYAINRHTGYTQIRLDAPVRKTDGTHRVAYELFVGPIPEGLVIDHLCRVRHCCNPDHLEPVTQKENSLRGESPIADHARQTHCVNGHEFTVDNTRVRSRSGRECKACSKLRAKERTLARAS